MWIIQLINDLYPYIPIIQYSVRKKQPFVIKIYKNLKNINRFVMITWGEILYVLRTIYKLYTNSFNYIQTIYKLI